MFLALIRKELASMGPGSFDPGSEQPMRVETPPPPLQWGRGLSTPEVRTPCARFVRGFIRLQWGRGLSTPEVMRRRVDGVEDAVLQWGRGLSTPEVSTSKVLSAYSIRLQWGRGLSTPEVSSFSVRSVRQASFNGAGVFRPRKYETLPGVVLQLQASMGPGSFDPGSACRAGNYACHPSRFNGAGVFRPRKSPSKSRLGCDALCFNGAGVFRPRKSTLPASRIWR